MPRSGDPTLFSSSRSPDQEPTVAPRCLAFSSCLQGLGSPVAVSPAPPARPAGPTEASRVGAALHCEAASGLRLLPALDLLSTFSSNVWGRLQCSGCWRCCGGGGNHPCLHGAYTLSAPSVRVISKKNAVFQKRLNATEKKPSRGRGSAVEDSGLQVRRASGGDDVRAEAGGSK